MAQLTWAINDWDKQENQWGPQGLVYMPPASAPLKEQLARAEASAAQFESLANKNKNQGKKGLFGTSIGKGANGGKDEAKYRYKARIARDHAASIKKKMQKPAPAAKKPAAPAKTTTATPAKPTAAPAKPGMNTDAIKDAAFGTEKEQAAADRVDTQKEIFDKSLEGYGLVQDTKDLVKTLKGPLKKGGGIIEMRDSAGFGDLQQVVKLALAKTPKEAYEVALSRREIYLRVNVMNEAAAKIVHIDSYFPVYLLRRTTLPEKEGPFSMRPIDPRNKQGTFALLGGASGDGILRKIVTNGRFIRAGISFCAETPDKKAHLDFSVGFDWEPGISIITNGKAGVSIVEGDKPADAFGQAKNAEATLTKGGLKVFVAIQGQTVVIAVGRV